MHLNGRHSHLAEELSVQQTSNSNSSLGGGSACSLVNNESLGLDERGIFEHLDAKDRLGQTISPSCKSARVILERIRLTCCCALHVFTTGVSKYSASCLASCVLALPRRICHAEACMAIAAEARRGARAWGRGPGQAQS